MNKADEIKFQFISESCLLISFGELICQENLSKVVQATIQIRSLHDLPILDIVPAYTTIVIFFDPMIKSLVEITKTVKSKIDVTSTKQISGKQWEIPVCYEHPYCSDLAEVAKQLAITEEEVISIHSSTAYTVFMRGFLPGFLYLGTLDKRLHIPRRATPRTKVPAGTVALGGDQTGLYAIESPGGWHILGQTPLNILLHQLSGDKPIQPGDEVRFVRISAQEFVSIKKEISSHAK